MEKRERVCEKELRKMFLGNTTEVVSVYVFVSTMKKVSSLFLLSFGLIKFIVDVVVIVVIIAAISFGKNSFLIIPCVRKFSLLLLLFFFHYYGLVF
jgi:hypothetical protein